MNCRAELLAGTGRLEDALDTYREVLHCFEVMGVNNRARAEVNQRMAEILLRLNRVSGAVRHWIAAFRQAENLGLEDEFFHKLETMRNSDPRLKRLTRAGAAPVRHISSLELKALEIAERDGIVSVWKLTDQTQAGRTTASKTLSALVRNGRLKRIGKGRATRYLPVTDPTGSSSSRQKNAAAEVHFLADWILDYVRTVGFVTSRMVEERKDISRATAKRILGSLTTAGMLRRTGRGRAVRYVIPF